MKLDLQMFSGGHSVTVLKDDGISAASASSTTDVQKDAEVTLTVTPASGYEIAEYEVVTGGVTVNPETKKFVMGEANVTIVVKSRGTNDYRIVENTFVSVNGTVTRLQRNMMLKRGVNGAVIGVEGGKTTVSLNADIVKALLDSGAIVKI